MAKRAGLRAVGITDHDCVDGIDPALREGRKKGVEVVPGVEMSVSAFEKDVHLLGYFLDPCERALLDYLDFF